LKAKNEGLKMSNTMSIKIKAIKKPIVTVPVTAEVGAEVDAEVDAAVVYTLETPPLCKIPAWYSIGRLPDCLLMNPQLFSELWALHPEELGKVKMLGKVIDTPRYQVNYGKEYFYTGLLHPANPIPHKYLEDLLSWVCVDSGHAYEQMIINWYQDGNHYIGPHSDSDVGRVPGSTIYSITFGGTRDFVIKSKSGEYRKVVPLSENTVLKMGGSMQTHFKHEVPKRKHALPRINITFRLMIDD
jgi:alkylated DNA repair dioxygenase AlkB